MSWLDGTACRRRRERRADVCDTLFGLAHLEEAGELRGELLGGHAARNVLEILEILEAGGELDQVGRVLPARDFAEEVSEAGRRLERLAELERRWPCRPVLEQQLERRRGRRAAEHGSRQRRRGVEGGVERGERSRTRQQLKPAHSDAPDSNESERWIRLASGSDWDVGFGLGRRAEGGRT